MENEIQQIPMRVLMLKAQTLCQLYESLTRNRNPSDNTRQVIETMENHINELAYNISAFEETQEEPQSTDELDDPT